MVVREFNLGLSDFDLNYLRWFTKYCLLLVFNTWTKGGGDFCSGCPIVLCHVTITHGLRPRTNLEVGHLLMTYSGSV